VADADTRVEVWIEKEALAGVVVDVTAEWDVPLMPARGYASISFLHSAAETIDQAERDGQRTAIYYLGDHDPSGRDMDRWIRTGIGESLCSLCSWDGPDPTPFEAFAYHVDFTRLAVIGDQIADWSLPTRPTKMSDTRSKTFKGESVELDSIAPDRLRQLVRDGIERHVDHARLDVLRTFEAEERKGLENLANIGARDLLT